MLLQNRLCLQGVHLQGRADCQGHQRGLRTGREARAAAPAGPVPRAIRRGRAHVHDGGSHDHQLINVGLYKSILHVRLEIKAVFPILGNRTI